MKRLTLSMAALTAVAMCLCVAGQAEAASNVRSLEEFGDIAGEGAPLVRFLCRALGVAF